MKTRSFYVIETFKDESGVHEKGTRIDLAYETDADQTLAEGLLGWGIIASRSPAKRGQRGE